MTPAGFEVHEATIAEMRAAMEGGRTTAVGLLEAYLARITAYSDLNAIVVRNPDARADAEASDARRREGRTYGPLDGIPYTAKDSYQARGLTVAAGSPAFAELVAQRDSFVVERLRAAGAVLIGLTNMPPMANGGMQRGIYGRAESPYDADYLTAPFASGSSNGSGTATAASLCAFGIGEETWSSGRGPASNNALCAYTPSRGVISTRGGWPLVPTMDVVVPQTRCMADLLEVLDVVVVDDPDARGDFWRLQPWVSLPRIDEVRPPSYPALEAATLTGRRFGVPRMYVNADDDAGVGATGIGGPTGRRIETRPSIVDLFDSVRRDLLDAGADVVDVDFPVVSNYEGDRAGAPTIATRGLVSTEFLRREIVDLSAWAWDDFLAANGDPALHRLAEVDGSRISPAPSGALPDRYEGFDDDIAEYPGFIRDNPIDSFLGITAIPEGVHALERTRQIDLEQWMDELGLDAVVFPAVADVGPTWTSTRHPRTSAGAMASGWPTATWRSVISAFPRSRCPWGRWPTSACPWD
jgi:amidase